MKKHLVALFSFFLLISCIGTKSINKDGNSKYESFSPDGIPFTIASDPWVADMFGNHRAVIKLDKLDSKATLADLPWRRADLRPDEKKILVVDAHTGEEVKNVIVRELTSERGRILFEPTNSQEYYIYYLPYRFRRNWDDARYGKPWNDYLPPLYEADESWKASLSEDITTFPKAKVLRFESRTRFDYLTAMGVVATQEETNAMKEKYPENPVVFTEDRAFPIKLDYSLPVKWIKQGASDNFSGTALRNEYYVWQIGIWAAHQHVQNIKLKFSDLTNGNSIIASNEITCFNQEGVNWDGKEINFNIDVAKNNIQALWCGVQIPENAQTGKYSGTVTLTADGISPRTINVDIHVENKVLADKGDGELWRHARLRWLNSRIGEDNLPVEPYNAMSVVDNEVIATGKHLQVEKNGLPKSILINEQEVLSSPISFIVVTEQREIIFNADNLKITKEADGFVRWESSSTQEEVNFICSAYMEYDGYIRYNLKVSSNKSIPVKDIRLVTEYSPYVSEYFMGVGFKGGYCPSQHHWDWKGPWDSYWMGNAKAGMHVEYRGGSYHGPLINDYKPAPPQVWANDGKGSISVSGVKQKQAKVIASTGSSLISPTEKDFEFALLLTPLKELNPSKHFSERYHHAKPDGFEKAAKEGANIYNLHHAQILNPVINYPFIVRDSLIQFIQNQHQHDRKVKIYYTVRELTNYTEEIYALKSMNHEIFAPGVGYGIPWLCEHLVDNYKPAWYTELANETSDAALVLSGFSRWINYYLEGLRWMIENYDIDGIYLDDVSFDRTVMKRMRKIMSQYKDSPLIDLHSNTGYSIGPANQYTDFFPYVDRLWFGESFKYNDMMPDEWFVTFSGIPFGVMSEMLQDGGNRFLGMIYGTTARHSYGNYSPIPVWALWKDFGIEDAEMLGYWDEKCPIKTTDDLVKATAYVKKDKVLISIANFDKKDTDIKLTIDWESLGMSPADVHIEAPFVQDFQEKREFKVCEAIPVKSKEGWLLILSRK